jgi:hypothetical protein
MLGLSLATGLVSGISSWYAAIFPVFIRDLQCDKAPITEEIVFRSCVIGVMRLANCSWSSMIFLSPLWFGAGEILIV